LWHKNQRPASQWLSLRNFRQTHTFPNSYSLGHFLTTVLTIAFLKMIF